jgi:hypothetical protein
VIRPGDVEQLRALRKAVDAGECPAVSNMALYEMVSAVGRNHRTHMLTTRMGALNLYAVLAAEHGDLDTAREVMRVSIGLASQSSPAWLKATLGAAAEAASNHATPDQAVEFMNYVTHGHEHAVYANDLAVLKIPPKAPKRSGGMRQADDGT